MTLFELGRRRSRRLPPPSLAQAAGRLLALLRDGLRALHRMAERRRAERALHAMPDAMLKDIGISRCDIRRRVHKLPD